jgi:hypothetical protein
MKKHFTYWVLLFAFVLIAGCKRDSVNPTTPIIAGKWKYTSYDAKMYINGQQTTDQPYNYDKGEYLQFNEDGTGIDYQTSFTYTFKNDQLIVKYGAYVDGGVSYDAYTDTCTVKELSANKLTIYYENSFKDSNNVLNTNTVTEYLSR